MTNPKFCTKNQLYDDNSPHVCCLFHPLPYMSSTSSRPTKAWTIIDSSQSTTIYYVDKHTHDSTVNHIKSLCGVQNITTKNANPPAPHWQPADPLHSGPPAPPLYAPPLYAPPPLYAVLKMMCTPESVQIGSDSSPTLSEKPASSNGFCIWPRPKGPRSPPRFAELQSLNCVASSANFFGMSPLSTIWCR